MATVSEKYYTLLPPYSFVAKYRLYPGHTNPTVATTPTHISQNAARNAGKCHPAGRQFLQEPRGRNMEPNMPRAGGQKARPGPLDCPPAFCSVFSRTEKRRRSFLRAPDARGRRSKVKPDPSEERGG